MISQNWNKPEDQRMAELEDKLADEIADIVIYADLLATRIGRSLGECVRQKFNSKSDEIGSAIKLAARVDPSPLAQLSENTDDQVRVDGDTQVLRRQDLPQSGHGR